MSSSNSFSATRPAPNRPPTPSVQNLAAQFNNVHLSRSRQAGFVGGFAAVSELTATHGSNDRKVEKPLPPTPSDECDYPNNIPLFLRSGHGRDRPNIRAKQQGSPPAMQMPVPMLNMPSPDQSLTMAYARSAPAKIDSFPFLADIRPSYLSYQSHSSSPSASTSSPLATPRIKVPSCPASTPASPSSPSLSSSAGQNPLIQCHGTTKAGKRCSRAVKAPPLVSFFAPTSSEPVERFCFQHVREVLSQSGFYSHKEGGGWVEFADWIPKYLHPDTQAALRVEMEKPRSLKDEPGYIYAYEIRDDRLPDEIKIKVGRAVKLVKRLDQWSKQCTSKEVIVRGWWPGTVEDDDGKNGTSLLRGKINAGEKGPLCHRLERLVHLELADLAVYAPYLESGFPNVNSKAETSGGTSTPSTPGRPPKALKVRMPGKPCMDCGAIHQEIFAFRRVRRGKYKDAEWKLLVQPVIAKWGQFVAGYV